MTIFRPVIYVPIFRPILKQQSAFRHWCFRVLHMSFEFTTKTALFSILQSCLIVITMTQTVNIEGAIKGYHHFRIRPHPDIGLLVQPENGNRFDSFAIKVMMPPLTEIPRNLHDIVTREQDRRHPTPQTDREIAGIHIHRDQPGFTMIYHAHMIYT